MLDICQIYQPTYSRTLLSKTYSSNEGEGERLRRGEGVGRVKGGKEREGGAEERGKDPLGTCLHPLI